MSGDRYDDPIPDGPLMIDGNPPAVVQRPMDHKTQPKKKDKGPIPARQSNGYYADHTNGDRLRSVTTILNGGVPKPALLFWAANTCTDSAIENLPALVAASRHPEQLEDLRKWIKRAHTRKKDERAEVGGLVHKVIESRILGTELPASIKVGDTEWDIEGPELAPFLEQILVFEKEWRPNWLASEMTVANPAHGYAGQLDYMIGEGLISEALRAAGFVIPQGMALMGDTKTGGELDELTYSGHYKGVYPEAGLQMSAYRNAEWCWMRDGSRVPMPATAEVGIVLHLRPEGFRIYPARCGDRQYEYFRHAQMVDEWSSRLASSRADAPIIAPPLVLPAASEAVA